MISGGWGFLHCTEDDGEHWTAVTSDVAFQQALVEATRAPGLLAGLLIPPEKYAQRGRGWPSEWLLS